MLTHKTSVLRGLKYEAMSSLKLITRECSRSLKDEHVVLWVCPPYKSLWRHKGGKSRESRKSKSA
jgi:hypothetical protein